MKLNQQPRNCGTCQHIVDDRYDCLVCYQIQQRNGKPEAVRRRRNNKACQSWAGEGGRVSTETCAGKYAGCDCELSCCTECGGV